MNKLVFSILALFILSCGGEKDPETVDFDEIAGETGVEEDTAKEDVIMEDNLFSMDQLIQKMNVDYDTAEVSGFHPMDRFSYSTNRKVKFVGKNKVPYGKSSMVTPTAEFYYYSFVDSNKTISAFYNYLDIMADEGEGGPVDSDLLENVGQDAFLVGR